MFKLSRMKQLIVLGTVLGSMSASAQWADDQPMPSGHERSPVFSTDSGAFIGLSKGFFEAEVDGYDDAGDEAQNFGVYGGFAMIKHQGLGFSARGIMDFLEDSIYLFRAEGNATFGLSDQFHLFGGLNVSKRMGEADESLLDTSYGPGIGYQFGAGVKLSEQFGLQAQYTGMNGNVEISGSGLDDEADYSLSGIEIGFNIFF